MRNTKYESRRHHAAEERQRKVNAAVHKDALPAEHAPEALEGELDQPAQIAGGAELGQVFAKAELADDDRIVAPQGQEVRPAVSPRVARVPRQSNHSSRQDDQRQIGQDAPARRVISQPAPDEHAQCQRQGDVGGRLGDQDQAKEKAQNDCGLWIADCGLRRAGH
jgi:hypothetical protein